MIKNLEAFYLYYHTISDDKDLTFKPTIFSNNIIMFQNEHRQIKTYFLLQTLV